MITLTQLNQMNQNDFVKTLGDIYEHTPQIAAQVWEQRPFKDIDTLHQMMMACVEQMDEEEQLTLIRAHPDLGSRAKMAKASVEEQATVGLNSLTTEEYDRFQQLNQAYQQKFGFPFIIAVKKHTKATILEAFELRLKNSMTEEKTEALRQINQIARLRLDRVC